MLTRYFALLIGIVYLLVGVLGFIPGTHPSHTGAPDLVVTQGYGYLLGLFPINVLHNIVHLLVGILGVAAYARVETARNYARGLAIFYGLLAIMGLIPGLNTTFGLIPIFGSDIWLHAGTALLSAYFGFIAPSVLGTGTTPPAGRGY
jgi:hypothetical protein